MQITDVIPHGAGHYITSSKIEDILNTSGGQVRQAVNAERTNGTPIASDSNGYFIAEKPEELDHTIAQLTSRIKSMVAARNGLIEAQEKMNNGELYFADMFGLNEKELGENEQ